MNRRATGVLFCLMAVALICVRHLGTAIISSSMTGFDAETFSYILEFTGAGLLVLSLACAVMGIVYLIFAELKGE